MLVVPSSLADCFFLCMTEAVVNFVYEDGLVFVRVLYLSNLVRFVFGRIGFEDLFTVEETAKRPTKFLVGIIGDVSIVGEERRFGLYGDASIGGSAINELLITPVIWYS